MLNSIIDGITIKLFELFGESCRIYVENVEQDLQKPCFIVSVIENSVVPFLGERAKLSGTYQIVYIPSDNEKIKEMNDAASVLLANMDYITLVNGDKLYGLNRKAEIDNDGTGDILRFFVKYNMVVNKKRDINYMQNLTSNTITKR